MLWNIFANQTTDPSRRYDGFVEISHTSVAPDMELARLVLVLRQGH